MNAVVATENAPSLPAVAARRGIAEATWNTLTNALYPGANPDSVVMVWDYCQARKLDPLKKPVHIVPMSVKDARTGKYEWRDVVMPGVYEHRITAQRTGEYLGHSKAVYGPTVNYKGIEVPEFCEMTMYRWNPTAQQRVEFPVSVYFSEAVGLDKEGATNATWRKRGRGMLTKCTEAAGLREAFPEEIGGEPTVEEMAGNSIIVNVEPAEQTKPAEPEPEGYASWLADLKGVADEGTERLQQVWQASSLELRSYLTRHDPQEWEDIKGDARKVTAL